MVRGPSFTSGFEINEFLQVGFLFYLFIIGLYILPSDTNTSMQSGA